VNIIWVKKITLIDLVIVLGFGLMVVGLGIKMKEINKLSVENKFIKVEKRVEPIIVLVNINTASTFEMEVLPSIGPVTAQKIVDYRKIWGSFKRKEDIKKVSGIGEKTYEKIKNNIQI